MSETIVDQHDAALGSTPLGKSISLLTRSKRMLLIVSPFLTIVIVLVAVAIASIDILAAGRAYVEGESLWSKNGSFPSIAFRRNRVGFGARQV
jgi:hypothetical protein